MRTANPFGRYIGAQDGESKSDKNLRDEIHLICSFLDLNRWLDERSTGIRGLPGREVEQIAKMSKVPLLLLLEVGRANEPTRRRRAAA